MFQPFFYAIIGLIIHPIRGKHTM